MRWLVSRPRCNSQLKRQQIQVDLMKMIVQRGEIQGETKFVLVAQVKNSNTVMENYEVSIFLVNLRLFLFIQGPDSVY